jgi:hypothetical protein
MLEHLVKKIDKISYTPFQLELRWASYCTRWAEMVLNAFKSEANQPVC